MTQVTKKQLRRRKGGIETIEGLNGVGNHTSQALHRNGYNTLKKLAHAALKKLENMTIGTHRTRLGHKRARNIKRQANRAK